jgi:integrase
VFFSIFYRTRVRPEEAVSLRWPDVQLPPSLVPPDTYNQTFKGQLDLERHGGRTPGGAIAPVLQRILALTAAIWHNDRTGQPVLHSLTAYDH